MPIWLDSSARTANSAKVRTATLKISLPYIFILWRFFENLPGVTSMLEPPAGIYSNSHRFPSESKWLESIRLEESDSQRSTIAAPAPSPKRMHDERSFQFMKGCKTSAPITKAVCVCPERINCSAVATPYTKPEQAALMSIAQACGAPILCCSQQAVEGIKVSGEHVA